MLPSSLPEHDQPLPRLPSELILEVIEWCGQLPDERAKTLASLCRLARAYQAVAKRALYSRILLEWGTPERQTALHTTPSGVESGEVPHGTALHTLVHEPRLAPLVKALEIGFTAKALASAEVAHLLDNLTNVEEVTFTEQCLAGLRRVVSQEAARILRLRAGSWDDAVAALVREHPEAFKTLRRLDLQHLTLSHSVIPFPLKTLEALTVEQAVDPAALASLTASCRDKLTSLRLPVNPGAPSFRLASFVSLVQLGLLVENEDEGTAFGRMVPRIVSILLSAASLPFLASLSITGRTSTSTVTPAPGYASPPRLEMSSKQVLNAIPFQIQHLSLDASCFLASDVVSYLLSPCRPPSLRSFRAGDDTGVGLARLLRRTTGRYAELASTLDQAGVAVTTVDGARRVTW